VVGEQGLPQAAIDAGYTTNTSYEEYLQQKTSDEQIAAQKEIAAQSEAFNEKSLQYQKDLQAQTQAETERQAANESAYETGRTQLISQGAQQVNDAFAKFTPDYYSQYAKDYMSQVEDQYAQQRKTADKSMLFGLARSGLSDSQALANQKGLLDEAEGRALAEQTQTAQQQAASLQSNVASTKQNLLSQIQSSEGLGAPVSTSSIDDVTSSLNTARNQISGITNSAGDVTASLTAVPTVSTLSNIFANVLTGGGSYLQGASYGNTSGFRAGLSGSSPSGSGSTSISR
jgi:hypothetical protein